MLRERAIKIVLVLVGLLFSAAIYPVIGGLLDPAHSDTGDTMMMGLYVALGIFLLIAVRNPNLPFLAVGPAEPGPVSESVRGGTPLPQIPTNLWKRARCWSWRHHHKRHRLCARRPLPIPYSRCRKQGCRP